MDAADFSDTKTALPKPKSLKLLRPELSARSSTDPSVLTMSKQDIFANNTADAAGSDAGTRHGRTRSPYSRSHLRSRSSGAALLTAPVMTRAHSLPNPHTSLRLSDREAGNNANLSPLSVSHSPMRSPARARSPLKLQQDATEGASAPAPRSPSWLDAGSGSAVQTIEEDEELDIVPPRIPSAPLPAASAAFSRSGSLRRRPASPLHSAANANTQQRESSFPASVIDQNATLNMSTASSVTSSPALGPQKYNEAFPPLHHYASTSSFSSVPSTPTSARSRSPSISSLETIEDAPDLESEAIESERIERLKLAAEREERAERGEEGSDGEGTGPRRRSSLDVPRGFRGGMSRERKRWSICGGERRADLDLETIWED